MPELNGTALLAAIRDRSPKTVRVVLTGYPGEAPIRQGLEDAIQYLIGKPWDDEGLRLTIREILQRLERVP